MYRDEDIDKIQENINKIIEIEKKFDTMKIEIFKI